MSWTVQPGGIVTTAWPDLARLPQPVFHRDELALLATAKAPPIRHAEVAVVKRIFRGAWVVAVRGPRKPHKPRGFPRWRARPVEPVVEDDE